MPAHRRFLILFSRRNVSGLASLPILPVICRTLLAGASNMGIAYKEVAGTFAYMTGKGSRRNVPRPDGKCFFCLGRGEVRDKAGKSGVKVLMKPGK